MKDKHSSCNVLTASLQHKVKSSEQKFVSGQTFCLMTPGLMNLNLVIDYFVKKRETFQERKGQCTAKDVLA